MKKATSWNPMSILSVFMILLISMVVFVGCNQNNGETAEGGGEAREPILLRMAAGSTGGAWYSEMSALAMSLEETMDNVRTSVSPGTVIGNMNNVSTGEADIGFTYTNSQEAAYVGTGDYEGKPLKNIRHVLTMTPLYLTIMTTPNSDIESFEDLLDKHVVVGDVNSIAENFFRMVLNAHGYTYDDIKDAGGVITNASYGDGTTMVKDKNADASCLFANHPNSNALTLEASTGVKLVPISEEVVAKIKDSGPGVVSAMVPDVGIYDFTAEDQVLAVGSVQNVFCRDDIPDDVVYNLCVAFYSNLDAVAATEQRIASLTPDSMFDGVVNMPIHPAAQQFYDDWKAGKFDF